LANYHIFHGLSWHRWFSYHAHPNVAKAGLAGWEIDVTWQAIAVLNTLALAKKVVQCLNGLTG
jgi:fatty-acid desaturase